MMDRKIRVRFAPSPTGPLHIGGIRTALYNYLFARKHGGDFILRIEDTDRARYVSGAEAYIIESLKWCGIPPNEGVGFGDGPHHPYRQSERKNLYSDYAWQLVKDGHAYLAFDTPEELEAMRQSAEATGGNPAYSSETRMTMKNSLTLGAAESDRLMQTGGSYVIRFRIPENEVVTVNDIIRGRVEVDSRQLDDKVLYKSDGMPTYHLANVVDDYLMKITHVIRGEEWLPSAPLHVLLYKAFGWINEMPAFAHLPLLLKPEGTGKLSKRDGDRLGFPVFPIQWKDPVTGETSMGYREQGYLPDAFANMLALLGWHPSDDRELFTMDELVKEFSLERISKAGARFNPEKTKWFNQQYLRSMNNEQLVALFKVELSKQKNITVSSFTDSFLASVCGLLKEKSTFVSDFYALGDFFFKKPIAPDQSIIAKKWNDKTRSYFDALPTLLKGLHEPDAADFETCCKEAAVSHGLKPGDIMQLLRLMVTGHAGGPDLFQSLALLGKEESALRIETALKNIH